MEYLSNELCRKEQIRRHKSEGTSDGTSESEKLNCKKEKEIKRREPNGKARVGKDRLCSIIK